MGLVLKFWRREGEREERRERREEKIGRASCRERV